MHRLHRVALWSIGLVWAAHLLGGCACFTPGTPTYSVNDPPALSPYRQPLLGPNIEPIPQPQGGVFDSPTMAPQFQPPVRSAPDANPADEPFRGDGLDGPSFVPSVPSDQSPTSGVELNVTSDGSQRAGEAATFRITIRNTGRAPIEDLTVVCEFDEALVFPGREEKQVQQMLGRLESGQQREMPLSLVGQEIGRHCAYFSIRSGERELAWKSACVEFGGQQQSQRATAPGLWSWWGRFSQ